MITAKSIDSFKHKSFIEGHCHEFAIALHKVFNYRLGVIKGFSLDKEGKKHLHLLHAYGVDQKGITYDAKGKIDISDLLKTYKEMPHPHTGSKVEKISINTYQDDETFKSKLWSIETEDTNIRRAIRTIATKPWKYFDQKSIPEIPPLKFKDLTVNRKYEFFGNAFYKVLYKYGDKYQSRFYISLMREFKPIGYWKPIAVNMHGGNGLSVELGIGTDETPLVTRKIIVYKNDIKDISDEESLANIEKWVEELTRYLGSTDVQKLLRSFLHKHGTTAGVRESIPETLYHGPLGSCGKSLGDESIKK